MRAGGGTIFCFMPENLEIIQYFSVPWKSSIIKQLKKIFTKIFQMKALKHYIVSGTSDHKIQISRT